jgi:hypothetical protein
MASRKAQVAQGITDPGLKQRNRLREGTAKRLSPSSGNMIIFISSKMSYHQSSVATCTAAKVENMTTSILPFRVGHGASIP